MRRTIWFEPILFNVSYENFPRTHRASYNWPVFVLGVTNENLLFGMRHLHASAISDAIGSFVPPKGRNSRARLHNWPLLPGVVYG